MILSAMTAVTLAVLLASFDIEEAEAQPECIAADNGTGTATLPADCPYISPDEVWELIDGLPPGTTIECDGPIEDFTSVSEVPGGTLGGTRSTADATLDCQITGTGTLTGFSRHIQIPVSAEIHWGPRNPGDPVQTFLADWYRLQGSIVGDPDFDLLAITAGTDYGLPSPGETTLTELPSGDFNIDSFFDITYQFQFVGAPGSVLEGLSGTTTATIRIVQGAPFVPAPVPVGGIAEPPLFAESAASESGASSGDSGWPAGTYVALAVGVFAVAVALGGSAWYARRRWASPTR